MKRTMFVIGFLLPFAADGVNIMLLKRFGLIKVQPTDKVIAMNAAYEASRARR